MAADETKVLSWPAIPTAKPEEVYAGLSDQAKAYPLFLESILRQEHNFEKPEALTRLRVLDCTTSMMIGHWCSSQLSELGAEVIQIEPPNKIRLSRRAVLREQAGLPPLEPSQRPPRREHSDRRPGPHRDHDRDRPRPRGGDRGGPPRRNY